MSCCAALLLLAAQAAEPTPPDPAALPAPPPGSREVSWEDFVSGTFDPAYALPFPTAREVGEQPRDLAAAMRAWLDRDLRAAPGGAAGDATGGEAADGAADGAAPFTVGDLIAAVARPGMEARVLERALETRARALPGLGAEDRRRLVALLATRALYADDWDPDDASAEDGVLHLPSWELRDDVPGRGAFWRERSGSDRVLRSAMLIFSDLQTWTAVENDAELYFRFAGHSFEEVYVEEGSEVHAALPGESQPVQGRIFYTRSDLPFPFGDYEARTRVRAYPWDGEAWRAEVYNRSSDFHWFAGRDTFLPVRTGDGRFVCWLLVQEFGFDLDGVPEGDDDRRGAVRSTIANKKRLAEPLYREKLASMAEVSSSPSGSVRGPK